MTDDTPTMTPDEIFAALVDYDYKLPEKALRAAESMPEIMTPLLLERLEQTLSNYDSRSDEDEWIEFYALFLLAEFKEERILELLRGAVERGVHRSEYMELPDGSAKLFASWAFKNPAALRPFVDNANYPEHIRSYALEANIVLYLQHVVSADEMQPYLHELAYEKLIRKKDGPDSWLWFAWAECCIVMGLEGFYPLIKKAFLEKWIDPMITDWEDMNSEIEKGREFVLDRAQKEYGSPIDDVVESLRGWHCFTEAARKEDAEREARLAETRRNIKQRNTVEPMLVETFTPSAPSSTKHQSRSRTNPAPVGVGRSTRNAVGENK